MSAYKLFHNLVTLLVVCTVFISVLQPISYALAMADHANRYMPAQSNDVWQGKRKADLFRPESNAGSGPVIVNRILPLAAKSVSVAISGPATGATSVANIFTATVVPLTATMPITYIWQATGQPPVAHVAVNSLTDMVAFTWPSGVSGTQSVTVTAANAAGIVTDTAAINILPLFSKVNTTLTGIRSTSVAWGDYDNDGQLDILSIGCTSTVQQTVIYHNSGAGIFTDIDAGLTNVCTGSVAWGDYDNDERLDILLTGWTGAGRITKIYHNNSNGTFTDSGAVLPGVAHSSIAWGDYDSDGRLDVLLSGETDTNTFIAKVYRNNGNGTFTDTNAGLIGVADSSVAWGDYNNDGWLDVLLSGITNVRSYITNVYRNNGNGTFTDINAGLVGVASGSVAWGDYSNDGWLDVLVTGSISSTASVAKIYHNNGDNTFTDINAGLSAVHSSSIAWGDYDNDGWVDILLTGNISSTAFTAKVYHNEGNNTFTDTGTQPTMVGLSSVAWGDYDNDGRLDILLTGQTNFAGTVNVAEVYHNNVPATNTIPTTSANLRAIVTRDVARLTWDTSTDGQTPAAGLTYNLRVGTTPGGSQIVAPMANTGNGYRRVPQLGNAQHGLTATLTLPPGTYYWSVQAVDTAWAGSPFATEGTFAISPINVVIDGPTNGLVNTAYTFTATVNPPTTTLPLTYAWQVDGQTTITHAAVSGVTDTVALTWPSGVSGTQAITVTAMNVGGTVTGASTIDIVPLFSEVSTTLAGVDGSSVAWGDYDNDDQMDILLSGRAMPTETAKVYHNNGNSTFTDINAGLIQVSEGSLAWGDYNSDDQLDILLTGHQGNVSYISNIYRNNGDGAFTDISAELSKVRLSSVAWGDYDNDGRLDILLSGDSDSIALGITSVYHNNGDGIFTDIGAGLSGAIFGSVAWGDYDNDGWLDILLTGASLGGVTDVAKIYHNNSDGTFTDIGGGLTAVRFSSVAWGDYDNDGWLDILLTGDAGTIWTDPAPVALIYHNNGDGSFTNIGAGLTGVRHSSAVWGDYDNDGWLDILSTGDTATSNMESTPVAKVYHNNGDGTFADISVGLTDVILGSVAWGDYDNDGRLDILLTGSTGTTFISTIYHNNTPSPNSVPVAPTGLRASATGTTVNLHWDAAADSQMPAAGLTYNLRVGTTPGGSQIVAPMADTGNGYRRVPQLGNAQHGLTATLTLPPGLYYWSVQAIDTAWAGSPFATEGTFKVGVPLTGVDISGPTSGAIDTAHTFIATVTPVSATLPVTYSWIPAPDDGQGTANATYSWTTAGAKIVTVTATNGGNVVTGTHIIIIPVPISTVLVSGPTNGVINTAYTFTATVAPITATMPISYVWSPPPGSGQGTANATYTWMTTGTQTIAVTATNIVNSVTATKSISLAASSTHICVMQADGNGLQPAGKALVYINGVKPPNVTDTDGCVDQLGLGIGDRVFAMITSTHTLTEAIPQTKYGIYATSLLLQLDNNDPPHGEMQPFRIANPTTPVTLTIYATNTLTLFDLNVVVEWNAAHAELEALAAKLISATVKLYNATDGQVMLRNVHIYTDTAQWTAADLRVAASQDVVANSIAYGVIAHPITLSWPVTSPMLIHLQENSMPFIPGYITIPRPRVDDPNEEDVYSIMQEFVHHFLGTLDEHLGWTADLSRFGPVNNRCVIKTPWDEVYASLAATRAPEGSQFNFEPLWRRWCEEGANYMLQGGGLWDTWKILYPYLITPCERGTVVLGPLMLPLTPTIETPPGDEVAPQVVHLRLTHPASTHLKESGLYLVRGARVIALGQIKMYGDSLDDFTLPGQQVGDQLTAWVRGEEVDGTPAFYGVTQIIPANPSFTMTLHT